MVDGRLCIIGLLEGTGLRLELLRAREGVDSGTWSVCEVVVVVVCVVGPSCVTVVDTEGNGSVPEPAFCLELSIMRCKGICPYSCVLLSAKQVRRRSELRVRGQVF